MSRQSEFHVELVQVIMRHGERAPLLKEAFPKDEHDLSDYIPWGLAQLTNKGKMTEYQIGRMLRERYDHFLGPLYYQEDVYAVSSDFDRTKMSLQLMLAGLYPPQESQQWNSDLKWLAIPTHYVPEKVDMLLRSLQCPLYKAAVKEVMNTNEVREKIASYHDFFKFLKEKTGLNIVDTDGVFQLYNGLTAQKTMNLTLPEWYTDEVHRKMQEIMFFSYDIFSFTTQLKRINGGFLVKKFIDNMNPKGDPNNKPSRKIYIYCAHELNIAAFARSHNITDLSLPDYGSAFVVEKLRDENRNFYVRIAYWTGVSQEFIVMKLKHCDEICPMKTYLELTHDIIPSKEEENCLWDNITKEELLQLYSEKINLD
ncbi:venom acid phosphatase Acph-1-like isoform X2 [Odontomachus brunneus]|uniref:venom acid phosphatase Acph-1-like isoform X2 n=1 Tax=Odontomachus brunneus TaxID=486640 RepID=UPI0013F1AA7E|nr:venom acid phosphatase Acph-1-like isoform X2 [Odontomachus brunneus]